MVIVRRRKWSKTAIYVHHFLDFCFLFLFSELPMFYMVIYVKINRQRQQKRLFWLSYLLYKPRGLCFKCGAVCCALCVLWPGWGPVCLYDGCMSEMRETKLLLNDRKKNVVLRCGQAALVVLLGSDGGYSGVWLPLWHFGLENMYDLQSKWFGQTLREGILWYRIIILFLSMRCKRLQRIGLHDSVQIFSERDATEALGKALMYVPHRVCAEHFNARVHFFKVCFWLIAKPVMKRL